VKTRKEIEKFQALYNQNMSSIKSLEGLATILNHQRNPKLKTGLGYEEGSSSDKPRNEEPIKFFKSTTNDNNKPGETKEDNQLPRTSKEKMPGLNLYNKQIMHSLLKDVINMEEINFLKEDNHFPGTKNFSMVIVSTVLTLVTKL
jgi:hypothetical protein